MKLLLILLLVSVCYGYDLDTTTIETVLIYTEHELTYETQKVDCKVFFKSGSRWYIKGVDGDYWSDKTPKVLNRRKLK